MFTRSAHSNFSKKNMLGERLRQIREEIGVSQAELVRRLNALGWSIEAASLNRIEKMTRGLSDIEACMILSALEKTWADLDFGDTHPQSLKKSSKSARKP